MTKLTEFAIKLFECLGYDYIHAPDIAPDKVNGEAREGALGHGDGPDSATGAGLYNHTGFAG